MIKNNLLLLLLTFSLSLSNAFGQNASEANDLENFWRYSIMPLIEKDFNKLDDLVTFPLRGEWGFLMGLKKEEKD